VNLPDDFRDVLVCLADARVDFMVVGGFAVAHHGHVRATKDIDVFVRPTDENARRVVGALNAFGAPLAALNVGERDFATPGNAVQLGVPPLRIDVVTSISGVDYDAAGAGSTTVDVEGRSIRVIGLAALVVNKRAAGRPQDLADVAALERRLQRGR
jgi:predicted nucleotidyltransferase